MSNSNENELMCSVSNTLYPPSAPRCLDARNSKPGKPVTSLGRHLKKYLCKSCQNISKHIVYNIYYVKWIQMSHWESCRPYHRPYQRLVAHHLKLEFWGLRSSSWRVCASPLRAPRERTQGGQEDLTGMRGVKTWCEASFKRLAAQVRQTFLAQSPFLELEVWSLETWGNSRTAMTAYGKF